MSWINDGVPARRVGPPVEYYDEYEEVATCPDCGCDNIGQTVVRKVFAEIYSWEDQEPDELGNEDWDEEDYADPRYYCCYCGHEFAKPYFEERLV